MTPMLIYKIAGALIFMLLMIFALFEAIEHIESKHRLAAWLWYFSSCACAMLVVMVVRS